ncbi:Gfo/Idh/MocA family protein [Lachnospiraceae bacterium LCP19S3_B12]
MPNQNRRFDADFLALKSVIDSGKLGELVRLESHYDYFRENGWYDHLGTLYNLGVHTVDQGSVSLAVRTGRIWTSGAFTIPDRAMTAMTWNSTTGS